MRHALALAPPLAAAALAVIPISPAARAGTPDFSEVTRLAGGAVAGQNVATPVPGFDLLLMRDGVVVYHRTFGAWSLDRVAAADSATKTFSGALIMSLTERAATPFSLDSRLSGSISQFSGPKQNITVRQCFSHTAGFGNSTAISDPSLTLQAAAVQIAGEPLNYAPGTTFSYTGVAMHAAGAAAELAGGAPWDALFQARIAGPLGLAATRYALTSPSNPRIAGGCQSTASEFARFMETLRRGGVVPGGAGGRILSDASVQAMFTRQTPVSIPVANSPLDGSSDYGVGVWLDQRDAQGNLVGALAAGARGFSCWIDFDDRMVGAFATDRTTSGNILPLLYLIRDAAQAAVREADGCPADWNRDGEVNGNDISDYINAWYSDITGGTAAADFNADAETDGNDVSAFINAWYAAIVGGGAC